MMYELKRSFLYHDIEQLKKRIETHSEMIKEHSSKKRKLMKLLGKKQKQVEE